MDNEKPIDYQVVLADLKARRDQLDHAIAVLEVLSAGALAAPAASGAPIKPSSSAAPTSELPRDAFFGMTVLEAAKKYLSMTKRPQSAADITSALQRGGYLFTASKPNETVIALMNRNHAKGGEIARVAKGLYGLTEWYPNRAKRNRKKDEAEGGEEEAS